MLGSSAAEAGFDPAAFTAAWPGTKPPTGVNAAIGASTSVERLLMSRLVIRKATNFPVAVLGFFDFELTAAPVADRSLTPPVRSSGWWTFVGPMSLGFRMEPAVAAEYHTGGSRWERALFAGFSHIPVCVERASTWGRIELLRRRLGSLGLPAVKTGHLGRAEDFEVLEAADSEAFREGCTSRLSAHDGFIVPVVDRMCRELRAAGMPLIVLEMPTSAEHRRRFYSLPEWQAHRDRLATELAERYQARYWVGADWVPEGEGMWFDDVHLDPKGAAVFSRRLARELAIAMPGLGRAVGQP